MVEYDGDSESIVPVFVGTVFNLSCNMLFASFEFTFDTLYLGYCLWKYCTPYNAFGVIATLHIADYLQMVELF